MLRESVAASTFLAVLSLLVFAAAGHAPLGLGLGAGLILGAVNGHLILATLNHRAPFVAASIGRLAAVSAVAVLLAILLGRDSWSVLIGVGAAQFVMVAAGVRQGLRA
jgi:hypothetical protein